MNGQRAAAILGAAALAACVAVGRRQPPPAPALSVKPDLHVLYYSDLGPEAVDVSSYPAKLQYDYVVFSRVCSQCHSLARAINAPAVDRQFWEFYLARMRLYSRFQHQPVSADETRAILDFLEYDTSVRKIGGRKIFEAQVDALKRRFEGR